MYYVADFYIPTLRTSVRHYFDCRRKVYATKYYLSRVYRCRIGLNLFSPTLSDLNRASMLEKYLSRVFYFDF